MERYSQTPEPQTGVNAWIHEKIDNIRVALAPAVAKVLNAISSDPNSPYLGKRAKGDGEHFTTPSISGIDLVGPNKPMGYYPVPQQTKIEDVQALAATYERRGLKTYIHDKSGKGSYALYVFHEDALQSLLNRNQNLLRGTGTPEDAESFVKFVAHFSVKPKTPLYTLIADAFGDIHNPGRA